MLKRHLAAAALATLLASPTALAAAGESRGTRALHASFYLNTVPTLVEIMGEVKPDVLDALELDGRRRALVEKALGEVWAERQIDANAAAVLEKQLPAAVLDQALARMTPEVQAAIKAGMGEEATPEQAKAFYALANKHPDAKAREALARRIVDHMPQAAALKELMSQVVEAVADTAQAVSGTDELRRDLEASLTAELASLFKAMEDREAMVVATVIAYRAEPTRSLKALADALDSEPGRQLQQAVLGSLIAGCKQTRRDLVARLERDLGTAPKK